MGSQTRRSFQLGFCVNASRSGINCFSKHLKAFNNQLTLATVSPQMCDLTMLDCFHLYSDLLFVIKILKYYTPVGMEFSVSCEFIC